MYVYLYTNLRAVVVLLLLIVVPRRPSFCIASVRWLTSAALPGALICRGSTEAVPFCWWQLALFGALLTVALLIATLLEPIELLRDSPEVRPLLLRSAWPTPGLSSSEDDDDAEEFSSALSSFMCPTDSRSFEATVPIGCSNTVS